MRCSFSTSAKRTCPSPSGPNPIPGDTATCAFSSSSLANSSEPLCAIPLRHGRPQEHRAARLFHRPAGALQAVHQDVAPPLVHRADLPRIFFALPQRDDRSDLDRLEHAVIQVALDARQGGDHLADCPGRSRRAIPPCCSSSTSRRSPPPRPWRPPPAECWAACSRRSPGRHRRNRGRSWCRARAPGATISRKKSRSTHVVVGLCGKEIRSIFGLRRRGPVEFLQAVRGTSAASGIGSMQAWPSAMSTPYWWIG